MNGPEFTEVEQPFIDQLVLMGWEHTTGDLDQPTTTGRESFREVLLLEDLQQALYRINLNPEGNRWFDEGRITQATNTLQRLGTAKLLEANQEATELLLKGTVVDGVEGWEMGRGRTVHFIDWEHPNNDSFRVINQFWGDCPRGNRKSSPARTRCCSSAAVQSRRLRIHFDHKADESSRNAVVPSPNSHREDVKT